jgi:hypothetical protein
LEPQQPLKRLRLKLQHRCEKKAALASAKILRPQHLDLPQLAVLGAAHEAFFGAQHDALGAAHVAFLGAQHLALGAQHFAFGAAQVAFLGAQHFALGAQQLAFGAQQPPPPPNSESSNSNAWALVALVHNMRPAANADNKIRFFMGGLLDPGKKSYVLLITANSDSYGGGLLALS